MLRGPSGGGKTSLLNIIGTIDRATGGVVSAPFSFAYRTAISILAQWRQERVLNWIVLFRLFILGSDHGNSY
jgi:ABC-type lipoprotein export system ATPase subunit